MHCARLPAELIPAKRGWPRALLPSTGDIFARPVSAPLDFAHPSDVGLHANTAASVFQARQRPVRLCVVSTNRPARCWTPLRDAVACKGRTSVDFMSRPKWCALPRAATTPCATMGGAAGAFFDASRRDRGNARPLAIVDPVNITPQGLSRIRVRFAEKLI
jgi:hypothetical protein